MLSLLRFELKQKYFSNPFRIRIFLFLSYSFGIETINTFIHSVVSSKAIPHSRQKWAKYTPVFRPKTAQKTHPMGRHTYIAYIREHPRVSFIGRFRKMRFHSLLKVSGKWNRKFRLNWVIIVGHVICKILKISLGNRETTKLNMFMLCYVPIIYTCTELRYL